MDREIQVDKMPPPSYPKSAVEQRQVGVVNLRVEVDAQGHPTDVQVLSATNPGCSMLSRLLRRAAGPIGPQ